MSDQTEKLFSPVQLGAISLSHRVVMAPLTRQRSEQPGDVPGPLMVEYYSQRVSEGGLIISEATTVAITDRGYLGAPHPFDLRRPLHGPAHYFDRDWGNLSEHHAGRGSGDRYFGERRCFHDSDRRR
jgi:hypothetical protein